MRMMISLCFSSVHCAYWRGTRRFETNSSSRADLNGRFTILRIVLGDFNPSTFEIFALVSQPKVFFLWSVLTFLWQDD